MPECILVALRGAGGRPAVHSAASVSHPGRLAGPPCMRPGAAARTQVHGQSALHGVFLQIAALPAPRGSDPVRRPRRRG